MKRGQESVHGWFGGFLVSRTSALILLLTMHEICFQIHLMAQYGCWSANNYICSPGSKNKKGARMKEHSLPLPLMSPRLELHDLPGLATKKTEKCMILVSHNVLS